VAWKKKKRRSGIALSAVLPYVRLSHEGGGSTPAVCSHGRPPYGVPMPLFLFFCVPCSSHKKATVFIRSHKRDKRTNCLPAMTHSRQTLENKQKGHKQTARRRHCLSSHLPSLITKSE
jgi:hypothetical protein